MYEKSRNILDCHIAGFAYYDGLEVVDFLKMGTPVRLVSESDNPYDPEAVAVYYDDKKLGYIPQVRNGEMSTLLYFGYAHIMEARISLVDFSAHPERQLRVSVKIKDNRV